MNIAGNWPKPRGGNPVPEDIFKPFDILTQFAPHNVVASLLKGSQVVGISSGGLSSSTQPTQGGQGGQGGQGTSGGGGQTSGGGSQAAAGTSTATTTPTTTTAAKKEETTQLVVVSAGPTYGGQGAAVTGKAGGGPGREEFKIPQQIKFKVTDKETKLAIPDAAISYDDGTILGATDYRGEFKTSDIPQGNHLVAIDAMGYDLYEQEVYVSPPSFNPPPKDYKVELSFLGELPGVGEGTTPPTEPYTPPTEPYTPPTGGYEGGGGGYGGGGYGGGGAPSYEAPSYQAPSYGAPSYGGPSYQQPSAPPAQTAPQAPSGLPLPPIEYLQQFFLLPFTTLQSVFSTPPPAPGPLPKGGQIAVYGKPRREILGYCPAEVIGKTVIY
jgi:DNA polymerase-3 subunit gamma/tau